MDVVVQVGDHHNNNNNNDDSDNDDEEDIRIPELPLQFWRGIASGNRTSMPEFGAAPLQRQQTFVALLHKENGERFVRETKGSTSALSTIHLDISLHVVALDIIEENDEDAWEEYDRRWLNIARGLEQFQHLKTIHVHAFRDTMGTAARDQPDLRVLDTIIDFTVPQLEELLFWCPIQDQDRTQPFFSNESSLCGHPNLRRIHFFRPIRPGLLEALAEQLISAPQLSNVGFGSDSLLTAEDDGWYQQLPDLFFDLLVKPSLSDLSLQQCLLTRHQCQVLSDEALNESNLESLSLKYSRLEDSGGALIAEALATNTSIKHLEMSLEGLDDKVTSQKIATVFRTNCTLERISIAYNSNSSERRFDTGDFDFMWLLPVFRALSSNRSLKEFNVCGINLWPDRVADAFRSVLANPTTTALEKVSLKSETLAPAWRQIMTVLPHSSRSLKILRLEFCVDQNTAMETLSWLQRNESLEEIVIVCTECRDPVEEDHRSAKADESLIATSDQDFVSARAVEALGRNSTLKYLDIQTSRRRQNIDDTAEGCQQFLKALQANYGLEQRKAARITMFKKTHACQMTAAIFDLNRAGRRYLLKDPNNKQKGLRVLEAVSQNLNALYFHLLENPFLCE